MIENSPELMAASKPQTWKGQKTLSIINTKNMYTWADHSQITENQRLRENLREEDLCLFTDVKYFRLDPGNNVWITNLQNTWRMKYEAGNKVLILSDDRKQVY